MLGRGKIRRFFEKFHSYYAFFIPFSRSETRSFPYHVLHLPALMRVKLQSTGRRLFARGDSEIVSDPGLCQGGSAFMSRVINQDFMCVFLNHGCQLV